MNGFLGHANIQILFFFECFCNQKRLFMYNLYVFSPQKSRFQSCCLHNHSNFQIQTPSAIRNLLHLAELWGRIHPHCSLSSGFLLKDSTNLHEWTRSKELIQNTVLTVSDLTFQCVEVLRVVLWALWVTLDPRFKFRNAMPNEPLTIFVCLHNLEIHWMIF